MTSGQPLLSTPESQLLQEHNISSLRINSLGHNKQNVSLSSSDETQDNLFDVNEEDKLLEPDAGLMRLSVQSVSSSSRPRSVYRSADSQFYQQFPLECPPREKRRLVSWGGVFDLQYNSKNLQKSMQFDDNLSHEDNPRLIYVNDPDKTNEKNNFTGNEIRTSNYTLLNFLPKNLFIQFHRVAYLYFLAIAALNQLPPLAVFGRTVSLFPLIFVLCVTAVKDGYEDWRRHKSDRKENNKKSMVLQSGGFSRKKWKYIRAGEVVKIVSNETIPCDMVLLGTSDPSGIAYIQTMNLDGESNLKTRYARQETTSMVFEGGNISGLIKCEQPNRNIYEFAANMELNGVKFPLSQSNIILRGCQVKNTEWVAGVVVYAGQETKAMMNSAISPPKRSRLESYMNRETVWLSIFLFIMCSVVATGMCFWLKRHIDELDTLPYFKKSYIGIEKFSGKPCKYYGIPMETIFAFLSSIIVFQIMIPISLYITMELVRVGQSYFMIGDRHMFDCTTNTRFQCRALNINEDLGQIRYVFSDKTGTLTENKMEFRRASVHGKNYGSSPIVAPMQDANIAGAVKAGRRRWKLKSEMTVDSELIEFLSQDLIGNERICAHEFFLALAACNTVIPMLSQNPSSNDDVISIDYQGESPDEQALVSAASAHGYTLFERTSGHIAIDVNGEKLRLDVLGMHEFDSVRKRMSVVIRFPNEDVKVLVKGADTSMFGTLDEETVRDDYLRETTEAHLKEYSSKGLRTLVIASKNLSGDELDEWQRMYEDASTSLTDRSTKLRQTATFVERNLHLLGATGIDDKLQEGVPEAIESLRQAGIKVWVLTGDKQETAISIGLSCKLITKDMHQIVINGNSESECKKLLSDVKAKYNLKSRESKNWNISLKKDEKSYLEIPVETKLFNLGNWNLGKEEGTANPPLALIIDGSSLVYILEKDLESELFDIATSCIVVICCRVAPLQKAGIVDLIKSRTDDMTLAIGDGANDVSMIQMADVGIGICGQEGRQAVMASDFSMGQFRFLKRLLLVHGHWNYQRMGYLVLYNFYRNAVFVLMLFWYILFTAFSSTSALTDWSSVFYSVIYTSVPTIVVGIMDKDLSHKTLLQYPKLYGAGHRHESYNLPLFWITMIDTLWQSLVVFYIPMFVYKDSTTDIWCIGSLWTIAIVIVVDVHLAMDVQRWVLFTHFAIWGSIVITYACMVVLDSVPVFPYYWTIFHLAKWPSYWLCIFLITVVAMFPRFIIKVVYQTFWPSNIQIAKEFERLRRRHSFSSSKPNQDSG